MTARPIVMCRSAGTTPSRMIAAHLHALESPDRAEFYTSGRTFERSRLSLSALRAAVRHQQFPRLLQHVPRSDQRRPAREHRHRQGHRPAGGFRRDRRDFRHRPESRHQQPADDDVAAQCVAPRRADRGHQSAAGAGARTVRGAAGPDRDGHVQLDADRQRILPGPRRRRRRGAERGHEARSRGARSSHRVRAASRCWIIASSSSIRIGFERCARICAARRGTTSCASPGLPRAQIERIARIYMQAKSVHHLLWHGHHAAPPRHGERPADRQSAADARQFRQAGRRHMSRSAAIPMCRATALSASTKNLARNCSAKSRRCSAFVRRSITADAVVDTVASDARRPVGGLHRPWRQFCRGGPRHRDRPRRDAAAEADRRDQYQAQPRPCRARPRGADPALPGHAATSISRRLAGRA